MALGFPVVGVGSSAGGISALLSLFRVMPSKTGLAFVVVQHLSPTHVSRLVWLLRDVTTLTVCEAVDGAAVEVDHVYVIAPGETLTIANGVLRAHPRLDLEGRGIETVDRFFESLAGDQGANAVGVVLSGAGSDGAAGALQIKMGGGKVFVQDPATAMYDSMPRATLGTGAANGALALGGLARALCALASGGGAEAEGDAAWKEQTTQALDTVRRLVRAHAGIDLAAYKSTPLLWRVRRRMEFRRIGSLPDYAEFLAGNPSELEALVRGIPIHVTSFFRDPEVWEVLAESVIAPLLASRVEGPPIRAWTTACSSGEEAYSLAMLLSEQAARMERAPDYQVFATDASGDIVARAGRGWFSKAAVEGLSEERRRRFFEASEGGFRVDKELRSKLVFARHDLLSDPPFSNLDLLTCRNLLIYMDTPAQEQVLALAGTALRSGGQLVLGSGEGLDLGRHGFVAESLRHRVYRKVDASRAPVAHLTAPAVPGAIAERAHLALLEGGERAGVLVDAELSVLHVYGDMDAFLRVPSGEPVAQLSRLARPGLGPHASFAVQQALDARAPVTTRRLWESPRGAVLLSTRVTPIDIDGRLRFLISFVAEPVEGGAAAPEAFAPHGRAHEEDPCSDERLRLSTEELQASREELHAVNEELRSVNDQLSIVNEQLATSNEQLNVANERLRVKLEELETQGRVLSSGAVMTLFLDEQLCVQWFTPAIRALFPLVPSDVGRPITDVIMRVHDPRFLEEVRSVMATGEAREDEVKGKSGRWYLRRIGVHRQAAGHPAGVVVTFTDVSARRAVEEALRESEERYRSLFERIDEGFCIIEMVFDAERRPVDYRFLVVNPAFERHTGIASAEGRLMREIAPELEQHWFDHYGAIALTGQAQRFDGLTKALGDRWFHVNAFPVGDPEQRRVAVVFSDVTQQQRDAAALRESEERQATLLALSDSLRPLMKPVEIQQAAMRVLVERLGVMRASCFEFDADQDGMTLTARHEREAVPIPERLRLSQFGPELIAAYRAGRTLSFSDTEVDAPLEPQREAYGALGIRAWIAVPLVKEGRLISVVGAHSRTPRRWTRAELQIVEEVAERTWAAVERARAEAALRDSEERLRVALEAAQMGTFVWYPDGDRGDADARTLALLGLEPGTELTHAQGLERIVPADRAAQAARVERSLDPAGDGVLRGEYRIRRPSDGAERWIATLAQTQFAGDPPAPVCITGVCVDVTASKEAEEQLRALEKRQAFLLSLTDGLRGLADASAVRQEATRLLRAQLGCGMVLYAEAVEGDDDRVVVTAEDRAPDMGSVLGQSHRFSDYGGEQLAGLRRGVAMAVEDVEREALTPRQAAAFAAVHVRSFTSSPLTKEGRLVAILTAFDSRPHVWTSFEQEILRETADRTWAAVERARAEAALRASEQRMAADLAGMRRLYDLHARLAYETDRDAALDELVAAACDFTGTDRGCVQLLSSDGRLEMITQRGYAPGSPFVEHFRYAGSRGGGDTLCWHERRLIIEDMEAFGPLEGTIDREVALAEGIRATQSTPMLTRSGELVGVLSTQFRQPHRPAQHELRMIDLLAWTAAQFVERHRADDALREISDRQAFLLELNDALRARSDGQSIEAQALRMLAEHLRLDRCWVGEIFEAQGIARFGPEQVRPGLPPLSGVYQLSEYPETRRQLTTQSLRAEDVADDPRFSEAEKALLGGAQLRALLVAPLRKGQRHATWVLAAAMATPRRWTDGERMLLEQAAERTWDAIERARAEAAVRESEARLAALFRALPVGVAALDASGATILSNPEWQRFLPNTRIPSRDGDRGWRWRLWNSDGQPATPEEFPGAQALRGESVVPGMEALYQEDDGKEIWARVSAVPVKGAEGRVTGAFAVISDVDALKRTAEALQQSHRRQAFLLNLSDALRAHADPAQIKVTASRLVGEQLGTSRVFYADADRVPWRVEPPHDRRADEAEPGSTLGAFPAAAWEHFASQGKSVASDDTEADARFSGATRDAFARLQIRASVAAPVIIDGKVRAVLLACQDVPRRWTADEIALLEDVAGRCWAEVERTRAERRAERILECMGDAHCVLDRDFRILGVNAATERVLGVPRAALLGRSHWDAFPASVDAPVGRALRRVIREGAEQHLTHHYTGESYDLHLEVDAYPTDEGGLAMFWRDVTERVRAEAATRASEEKYRALFDRMDEAYAVVEVLPDATGRWADLRFLEVNPAFSRQTGLPSPVGRTAVELVGAPNPRWAELCGRVVDLGESIRVEETEPTLRRVFDVHIFPVGSDGSPRVAVLFADVSERRRAEEALRRSEERLQLAADATGFGPD